MSRALRVAMLTHSTLPRGGVVHAMSLCEALEDLGVKTVLHAPDSAGRGFFRKPRCDAIAFPVEPAPRQTADMVEQRIDDYLAGFGGRRTATSISTTPMTGSAATRLRP